MAIRFLNTATFTGNVGIGTTNPQTKLQLGGSGSDTNLGLSITNPDGANIHFRKKSGFNNALEIVNSNNDINIITGTTSCIFVESANGNVGIRNTAPSSKLEIGDNVNANNVFRIDGVHSRVLLSGNVDAPTDGTGMWNFINHAGTNATTRFYVQDANNADSRLTFRFTGNGGSTEILSGSSTGNVGIGTVSPGRKLEVAGDVGINGYIHHNGDNSRIGFEGNDVIRMYTANTVRLQVNTNGNVGIGTTTVTDNRLKVIGGFDYQTLNIGESQLNNTIKRSGLTAAHYTVAEQDISMMSVFSSSNSTALSIGGSAGTLNAAMDIRFYTASNTTTTTGTQRMVIRSSGKVGIGTNEPATQLTLGTGSTGISFQSLNITLNSGKIAVIKPVEVGNGNGELVFETYKGGSGGGERMRIDNDGNVGIGTTNPGSKLDIVKATASSAQQTILKITNDSSADQNSAMTADIDFFLEDNNTVTGVPQGRIGIFGSSTGSQSKEAGGRLAFYTTTAAYPTPVLTRRMTIEDNGGLSLVSSSALKGGGGSWGTYSDERVKKDVSNYTKGLNEILAIKPITYKYNGKANLTSEKQFVGIIAQEIKEVLPSTVEVTPTKLNNEDEFDTDLLTFDASELTFTLINAVKELKAEIEELKKQINK